MFGVGVLFCTSLHSRMQGADNAYWLLRDFTQRLGTSAAELKERLAGARHQQGILSSQAYQVGLVRIGHCNFPTRGLQIVIRGYVRWAEITLGLQFVNIAQMLYASYCENLFPRAEWRCTVPH